MNGGARLAAWWKPKATNLLAVVYAVILLTGLSFSSALTLLVPSVLTIFGIGTLGHLLNDWCDIEQDAAVGKPNWMAMLPRPARPAVTLGALSMALLPWLILPGDLASMTLLMLELALLVAYAVPPFRLKERRMWAVIADAAYAYAVPAVLAAHTYFLAAAQSTDPILIAALVPWQLAIGVRHFLNHVAVDRANDLAAGTKTVATERGNRYVHEMIRRNVLPVEAASFAAFLLAVGRTHPVLPIAIAGIFLLLTALPMVLAVGRSYPLFTYRFSRSTLDRLYQEVLPIVLLLLLILMDWRFALFGLAHAFLFHAPWKRMVSVPFVLVGSHLSLPDAAGFVQWPALDPSRPPDARSNSNHPRHQVDIAIVNINRDKYTETFVHGSIRRLGFRVHYLYGGELPRFDADDRHFLSNWPSLQSLASFLESLLRLEPGHFLRQSIASYLQAKNVRLVFAHFGPVAIRMLPITKDLGIPLVVCFHGYDVFHRETLRQCADGYRRLFREADTLVGVSEHMLTRLHELGAPRDKLRHLPAFVNLGLFPYADHSRAGPQFLAVGRFAETKSPHLTILAFHRVAQRLPDATLTMIGKGGGGELFEACLILVRSLGLEGRVELMGVLPHDRVAEAMLRARVFVQHSVTTPEHGDREGKPVAVMEAMACGLPVVATRHSGIAELIEDGVTGLLVEEYDVDAMSDAMFLLATNDQLSKDIGERASRRIHEDPLIKDHVRILETILDESIARA